MNQLIPIVAGVLVTLIEKLLGPKAADKAREPSTVIGLAELTALLGGVLAHVGVGPEWAEPASLVILGALACVNVYRKEHGKAPVALPPTLGGQDDPGGPPP